jgi:hypothetical protein
MILKMICVSSLLMKMRTNIIRHFSHTRYPSRAKEDSWVYFLRLGVGDLGS